MQPMDQMQTSLEWEEKVSGFIEENDKLLVDAGPDTAQRLLLHTKNMLAELIDDATATSDELASTLYKLADAINNPGTLPSAIMLMEKKKDVLEAEHNAFVDIQQRMQDFHDEVEAYQVFVSSREADKERPANVVDPMPRIFFWHRLFSKR